MGKLKVYYGWTRIGNVRKKRALSVMFENDAQGCRSDRGQRCLRTIQDTVFERYQTKDEEQDGRKQNRIFTPYSNDTRQKMKSRTVGSRTVYSRSTACFLMRSLSMAVLKDACLSTAKLTKTMCPRLCVKEFPKH